MRDHLLKSIKSLQFKKIITKANEQTYMWKYLKNIE